MSNTPRTDAVSFAVVSNDDKSTVVWSDFARELERENAALRDAIEESEEFARKNGETCGSKIRELLAENAALRADKERLDWLLTDDGGFWVNWMYDKDEWTPELKASRDAIDACWNGRIGRDKP